MCYVLWRGKLWMSDDERKPKRRAPPPTAKEGMHKYLSALNKSRLPVPSVGNRHQRRIKEKKLKRELWHQNPREPIDKHFY